MAADDELFLPVGFSCENCASPHAKLQCSTCGAAYCGQPCQLKHWPNHKDFCIPRLILISPLLGNGARLTRCQPVPAPANQSQPTERKGDNVKTPLPAQQVEKSSPLGMESKRMDKLPEKHLREQKNETKQPNPTVPTVKKLPTAPVTVPTSCLKPASAGQNTDAKRNSLEQAPFPEPGKSVRISHVESNQMYIYEVSPKADGQLNPFDSMIKRCIECARDVKRLLVVPPSVGDILFAPFEGEYYRAMVKSIEKDKVNIFFPDFGNSAVVEWKTLKEIPDPKIKYAKSLAHLVWIDNISSFTPAMRQFLLAQVDVELFKLITVIDMPDTAIKLIELRHAQKDYILSAKLLSLADVGVNAAKGENKPLVKKAENVKKFIVTNPDTYKPITIEELVECELSDSKGIDLVIVDVDRLLELNQLSVITKSKSAEFEEMLTDCQQYGKIDRNPFNPKENQICLLQHQDVWYRAIPFDIKNGIATSFFMPDTSGVLDAGTNPVVRRYPPSLTRNIFLVDCIVENVDVLLKAIEGKQEKVGMLRGKTIKADLQKISDSELGDTTYMTVLSVKN